MSAKPQFAYPKRYTTGDCPGPECTYGIAKFCVYEVSTFGSTKTKLTTKIIRLCAKCRKTNHISEAGRIVKGATIEREPNRVYLLGHRRYRNLRSNRGSVFDRS